MTRLKLFVCVSRGTNGKVRKATNLKQIRIHTYNVCKLEKLRIKRHSLKEI